MSKAFISFRLSNHKIAATLTQNDEYVLEFDRGQLCLNVILTKVQLGKLHEQLGKLL